MPWAAENTVSTDPIEGGIEISDEQYQAALEGMIEGKRVTVEGGGLSIIDPPPETLEPSAEV